MNREKVLKRWRREKKIQLVESVNPQWDELLVKDNSEISHPADSK